MPKANKKTTWKEVNEIVDGEWNSEFTFLVYQLGNVIALGAGAGLILVGYKLNDIWAGLGGLLLMVVAHNFIKFLKMYQKLRAEFVKN